MDRMRPSSLQITTKKKRKAEQDKAMQERIELRQRQKGERQEKMNLALVRAREKREGLEKFLTEETFDTTTALSFSNKRPCEGIRPCRQHR